MSNTKDKVNLKFLMENNPNIPIPNEVIASNKNYVLFGEDNNFPQTLLEYYNECTILQSCCNTLCDYAIGSGFDESEMEDIKVNSKGLTLYELYTKCTLDFIIFGAFSINVLLDTYGQIAELHYLPVQNIRISEDEKYAFYNDKWGKYTKNLKKYDLYNEIEKPKNSIFYYKSSKSRGVYGLPLWSSCLKDVKTQIEISNFHLNSILNNFASNLMISFCEGVPDETIQKDIERKITEKFCSSHNGSRIMLTWSDSAENAPKISRIVDDGFDNKYQNLADSTKENILSAFRCSAQLVGVSSQATGFSAIEYENAFSLWKTLVVKPLQKEVEKGFHKLHYKNEPKLAEAFVKFDSNNNTENIL